MIDIPHWTHPSWPEVMESVAANVGLIEQPKVSTGLYVAKHTGRRCYVASVSNWTLMVKWDENSTDSTFYPIDKFLSLYERV